MSPIVLRLDQSEESKPFRSSHVNCVEGVFLGVHRVLCTVVMLTKSCSYVSLIGGSSSVAIVDVFVSYNRTLRVEPYGAIRVYLWYNSHQNLGDHL